MLLNNAVFTVPLISRHFAAFRNRIINAGNLFRECVCGVLAPVGTRLSPRGKGSPITGSLLWIINAYHIQNVNGYISRLKGWIQRFHGEYLPSYLAWRRLFETSIVTPENWLRMAVVGYQQ